MTEGAYGEIPTYAEGFDFWHPDNVAPMAVYLCSDAASHISGKVFGVQGDVVELYRPVHVAPRRSSTAAAGGRRPTWRAAWGRSSTRAGIVPGAENMMGKLRYSMTERA